MSKVADAIIAAQEAHAAAHGPECGRGAGVSSNPCAVTWRAWAHLGEQGEYVQLMDRTDYRAEANRKWRERHGAEENARRRAVYVKAEPRPRVDEATKKERRNAAARRRYAANLEAERRRNRERDRNAYQRAYYARKKAEAQA